VVTGRDATAPTKANGQRLTQRESSRGPNPRLTAHRRGPCNALKQAAEAHSHGLRGDPGKTPYTQVNEGTYRAVGTNTRREAKPLSSQPRRPKEVHSSIPHLQIYSSSSIAPHYQCYIYHTSSHFFPSMRLCVPTVHMNKHMRPTSETNCLKSTYLPLQVILHYHSNQHTRINLRNSSPDPARADTQGRPAAHSRATSLVIPPVSPRPGNSCVVTTL